MLGGDAETEKDTVLVLRGLELACGVGREGEGTLRVRGASWRSAWLELGSGQLGGGKSDAEKWAGESEQDAALVVRWRYDVAPKVSAPAPRYDVLRAAVWSSACQRRHAAPTTLLPALAQFSAVVLVLSH